MSKMLRAKESSHSLLRGFWKLGVLLVGGAIPLFHHLQEGWNGHWDHYASELEKRLSVLALFGFAYFLGLFSIWIGFIFIAIDVGGVPRGIACLGSGLFFLALFYLSVQLAKQKEKSS